MTPSELSISQGSLQLLASAAVFPLYAELGWISITAPFPSLFMASFKKYPLSHF